MWQDKTKPFVHRDVLQCCSCHSETRRDCTALWPVQRRVKHEFLWDVLVLYHKWATGLGLEHLGLNLFTQTQLPFSWGRQLFSISTPALQWDAKLWLLVEGLRDMSCSAAGVHDNPNKAARSVACSAGLRASWTGHPAGVRGGQVGRNGELWLLSAEVVFPQSSCPFIHFLPERSSLEYGYTQRLSCTYPYCQGKDWDFACHSLKVFERHRCYQSSLC